jgi:hypothetical protein
MLVVDMSMKDRMSRQLSGISLLLSTPPEDTHGSQSHSTDPIQPPHEVPADLPQSVAVRKPITNQF